MSGWTLAFQIVNFLVLVALLRRFLFKPVLGVIEHRQEELARQASDSDKRLEEARELRARAEKAVEQVGAERDRMMAEARSRAEREHDQALADAHRQAEAIVASGQQGVERERERAAEAMLSTALELATSIAMRLLEQVATAPLAEAFLQRLCEYLDALPAERRHMLQQELDEADLLVATSPGLAADAAARWSRAIGERFGAKPARLVSDSSLIVGAELRLPYTRISFSWRDGLRSACEGLTRHAYGR
jgi:F-type H+-transporting ATPase subunit b